MLRLVALVALALAIPASSEARPLNASRGMPKLQSIDLLQTSGNTLPEVFRTAGAGTTFFGGTYWAADSMRWEAYEDRLWTFDTGVGSSLVPSGGPGSLSAPTSQWVNPHKTPGLHATLEGWVGFDNTFSFTPYFRRLAFDDPRWSPGCVGGPAGLPGNVSFWAGVLPDEANALCYAAGQGYGNAWHVCLEHEFPYSGGSAVLTFQYRNDTEDGFDYTYVYCDTSGNGDVVELESFTGVVAGTDTIQLHPGAQLPIISRPVKIQFCVVSDGAWSDEDGLYPTDCGAFALDNVSITGAIVHSTGFELGEDGWVLATPPKGLGGEWSNLYHLNDLPPPLTPCACALFDSVLAFKDDENSPCPFNDNLAASPWIDLKAYGKVGALGKIIKTNLYADLPLRNYLFLQLQAQWYPAVCSRTGKLVTSPWTSNGYVYYFGGSPQCTSTLPGTLGFQLDFSAVIPPGAEQVRIALGVLSYCRFFLCDVSCASNSSPWLDNVGLGVYGSPDTPFIVARDIDRAQDNFPENGSLLGNAPGRIDCNTIQGELHPKKDTTLGDTLIVRGALGNDAVFVNFRVIPGPGTNLARFNAWYGSQALSSIDASFKQARMDTAEWGGVVAPGIWMTAYHESDPHFTGTDRDIDPTDLAPNGGQWRLRNDIFPDDLFPPGTRIDYFYSGMDLGSGETMTDPPGSPATVSPYEVEILPSSFDSNNTFNCVLYVDHASDGAQSTIENGLGVVLGYGSANAENTRWDRYDVNAASGGQASLGRPLRTEYGATLYQLAPYKGVIWNSGNLNAFTLTNDDANLLRSWLFYPYDYGKLYLSGDGLVYGAFSDAGSLTPRLLLEDMAGVRLHAECAGGTFRDANCPGAGVPQDGSPCVDLVPMPRAPVASSQRSVGHVAQGNGCPELRSFDVLETTVPDRGASAYDEMYSTPVKSARGASVATDASSSGVSHYKIVVDGVSIHERRDAGTPCDLALGGTVAVTERLEEVLRYLDLISPVSCYEYGIVGVPRENQGPSFQTELHGVSPNPLTLGHSGSIRFSLANQSGVTLDIFDLEGRLVKTLFDGQAKAGENEVTWDGTDGPGHQVASGIYFYRLRALGVDLTKKMVVVRKGS